MLMLSILLGLVLFDKYVQFGHSRVYDVAPSSGLRAKSIVHITLSDRNETV